MSRLSMAMTRLRVHVRNMQFEILGEVTDATTIASGASVRNGSGFNGFMGRVAGASVKDSQKSESVV
jgi:hypothetical protein